MEPEYEKDQRFAASQDALVERALVDILIAWGALALMCHSRVGRGGARMGP